ncbi:MAG: FAD/NAD(P)-binding protein [Deltaproteobacteria bacterium]|nr:FAD/NAD(P)-binding protein [Deltaproteobacteria bacterium]
MLPIPYRIKAKRIEAPNVATLYLEPRGNEQLAPAKPGQFNMLYCFGIGEIPISYSDVDTSTNIIPHTIRGVGAVSRALLQTKKGDIIGLRGPYGSHWPIEEGFGRDIVVIAGGIGLVPLRPLIHLIATQRNKINNAVIFYGARSPKDILFKKEFTRLERNLKLEVIVDIATDGWMGNVGVVTSLLSKASANYNDSIAFVCGPEIMMRFAIEKLIALGQTPNNIFLSMERNMKCAIGHCGHCMFGSHFVCKDGPVFRYSDVEEFFVVREF